MNHRTIQVALYILAIAIIVVVGVYAMSKEEIEITPTPEPTPAPTPQPDTEQSAIIETEYGDLFLNYKNGTATLSGMLARSTPCIEWSSQVITTKDLPPSQVTFVLKRSSTAEVCIQVLGKPYEVNLESSAGATTNYTAIINGDTVFSSKLSE